MLKIFLISVLFLVSCSDFFPVKIKNSNPIRQTEKTSPIIDDAQFDQILNSKYFGPDEKNRKLEGLLNSGAVIKISDAKFEHEVDRAVMYNLAAYLRTLFRLPNRLSSEQLMRLVSVDITFSNQYVVSILVENGAKVTRKQFLQAYDQKLTDLVKQILKSKALDVNELDQDQNTLLIAAASSNEVDLVRLLLEHGAQATINQRNKFDDTALDWRVSKLQESQSYPSDDFVLTLLCAHGAETNNLKDIYTCSDGWNRPGDPVTECRRLYRQEGGEVVTKDNIKSLYRKLIRKYHPDRCDQTENCRNMTIKTNECQKMLLDNL